MIYPNDAKRFHNEHVITQWTQGLPQSILLTKTFYLIFLFNSQSLLQNLSFLVMLVQNNYFLIN